MADIKRLAFIAVGIWLMILLIPILTPFLLAGLLAYLGDPLVDMMHEVRVPRTLAVVIVFVLTFVIIIGLSLLVVPMIEEQFLVLVGKLPAMVYWVQSSALNVLSRYVDIDSVSLADVQQSVTAALPKVGEIAQNVFRAISYSGLAVVGVVFNFFLIIVVAFYLMRDWNKITIGITNMLPVRYRNTVVTLACNCDEVLGAFFRGQLLVMFALAAIYSIGLSIMGLDVAFIIGVIAGLISIVPYLGSITGFALAVIAALFQFHTGISVVWVTLIFGIGQVAEAMFLTPLLVGDRIGLHPVAVIFAVMAGGSLFGFFGVLLALPVAAVIMVIARHFWSGYRSSDAFTRSAV